MGNQVQIYNLPAKILKSVKEFSGDVFQRMLDKQAEYDASMNKLSVFNIKKNLVTKKYLSAKAKVAQGKDDNFDAVKSEYNSVLASHFDAEMNSDILRGSLMDAIFYNGRIQNS